MFHGCIVFDTGLHFLKGDKPLVNSDVIREILVFKSSSNVTHMCIQVVRLNKHHPDLDIYDTVFSLENIDDWVWQTKGNISSPPPLTKQHSFGYPKAKYPCSGIY